LNAEREQSGRIFIRRSGARDMKIQPVCVTSWQSFDRRQKEPEHHENKILGDDLSDALFVVVHLFLLEDKIQPAPPYFFMY